MTEFPRDDGSSVLTPIASAESDWAKQSDCQCGVSTVLLSVIIPVYNEEKTIDALLRRVLGAPYQKQVIVVDDGSRDGTRSVLDNWEGHPNITILRHPANRGKGAAI